jgi:small GTP-binding protein
MVDYDSMLKLIIFGDGGVGKTSLTQRYLTGVFADSRNITIGADFFVKNLSLGGKNVKLQIWDFAGEERFRFLLPVYVKGANGGIFIFDVTQPVSLQHLPAWMEIVTENAPNIPILLVGTKIDLKTSRKVVMAEAVEMAQAHKLSGYAEVSAKTGANVPNMFDTITKLMLTRGDPCASPKSHSVHQVQQKSKSLPP